MSLDLILIIAAVVIGLAYLGARNNRKQRQLREQARRAAG